MGCGLRRPITWNRLATSSGRISFDNTDAHHGYASLRVDFDSCARSGGIVAATNRGIGNEGLYLQRAKEYEGYFFAKARAQVRMVVALRNYRNGVDLARQEIMVGARAGWQRYNFSLLARARRRAPHVRGSPRAATPTLHAT